MIASTNFAKTMSKSYKFALNFFKRSKSIHGDIITRFRATAKVHKSPVKLRLMVAKVGTRIEAGSKWLDVQLPKLI